jgi:hypothetical protein
MVRLTLEMGAQLNISLAGHDNVIELMQRSFIPHFNATYLTDNSLIKQTGKMIGVSSRAKVAFFFFFSLYFIIIIIYNLT